MLATGRRVAAVLIWAAAGCVLLRLYRLCGRLEAQLGRLVAGDKQLHERLQLLEAALASVEGQLRALRSGKPERVRAGATAAVQPKVRAGTEVAVSDENRCASRIQTAYRGHRARRAFFDLVAQRFPSTTVGGKGLLEFANRGARRFWDENFGERRASYHELFRAFDRWLLAGDLDEHDRPEVVRRLELVLKSSGSGQLLVFADLQRLSQHIIPFTPARVKEFVLSDAFSELHGLDKALLLSNGWSDDSYLELISCPHARYWWSGCIGEKRIQRQGMLNAIGAWLHCRQADLHKDGATGQYSSAETPHELSEEEIRLVIERMSNCKVLFPADQAYVSWEEWNSFVDNFRVVPFTAQHLAEIVLSENWPGMDPSKQQTDVQVSSSSNDQHLKCTPRPDRASSKQVASPGTLRRMRSYEVEFRIDYNDLEISQDKVGSGGYGSVYKGVWKTGHIVCAIKLLNKRGGDVSSSDEASSDHDDADGSFAGTPRDDFEREMALLRELRHPNLVVCYGVCPGGPGVPRCLVEELCLTSLDSVLHGGHGRSGVEIAPARLLRMCMGIAAGLAYIHSRGIVHRDMKSGNVLLDQFKQVKICDFGISAFLPATQAGDTGDLDFGSGTPAMMAPELFEEVPPDPDPAADMYAFGVLLWEMGTRERPWRTIHPAALPNLVGKQQERPPLPGSSGAADSCKPFSASFEALVMRCWDQDASARPTASAAYNALKQAGAVFAEDCD